MTINALAPTVHGTNYSLINGDCCEAITALPDNSVDLWVYSPPFRNLYVYSDSAADMGNCNSSDEFIEHYSYLIREMHRVTVPGRLSVVHCKDLPNYKGRDGAAGLSDFPGDIIRAHTEAGWQFHSRVTIWKDPVVEQRRTNNSGLLYSNLCEDSAMSRQGMADYLVVFRKWDGLDGIVGPKPVTCHGERFSDYIGMEPPDPRPIAQRFGLPTPRVGKGDKWPRYNPFPEGSAAYRYWSITVWQKYASPVWFDIDQTNVLNYEIAREARDDAHICPLQLDVAARAIHLWSNPGDVVGTPFAGVGSEVHEAVRAGRKGLGIELKPSYFDTATRYLNALEVQLAQPTLFDALDAAPVADESALELAV